MGFFSISLLGYAQNQNKADSLISLLNESNNLSDSSRLNTYYLIVLNHTNQDSIIHYAQQAVDLAEYLDSKIILTNLYLEIGNALRAKGDLDEALTALIKYINLAKNNNLIVELGSGYSAMGDVYSVQGNSKNSLLYYNKAISLFREENDSMKLATSLLNTGDEYFNHDKLDSALIYFEESSDIFEKLNSKIGKAYNLGNIGLVYAKQGKHGLAEENITQATRILEELGDYYPIAVYETYMADIYNERGDLERALTHARKSLKIAEEEGLKEQIRDANQKLSELHLASGDYRHAFEYQSQYFIFRDSINNAETIQKMADLRTDFEVAQKQAELDLANKTKETQQIIGMGLGIVLLLLAALAYILFRNNKQEKKTNLILSHQKEEITSQRDQLSALNKTKDRFFSIISHDLRGPVNAFQGITRIIKAYADRDQLEKIPQVLDVVDRSSNQLSGLLDNLLNWALSQQGSFPYTPEKLYLNLLADELMAIFHNMAMAKNIKLIKSIDDEIYLWCDRNSTMAIFRNLINNALKFTPEDGTVTLAAGQDTDHCWIAVIDTGLGIPTDKLEKLFELKEKKQSTDGTAGEKGTGLGLVICKEFAQLNHGQITVENGANEGATFTVTLPLYRHQEVSESG
ncbi:tetratricopeptide repeat protein [Fulvivirgaceae bacterium BMA12]|uniref:histidine kinase n=1 Tax=Agaribacillus aureus TaxID=3051825 RepID=A0ABT8L2D2_9BACT|nr:tetratricopeptide repeat protein [Fulvivirgaceae bacterium BMA12]